MHKSGYGKQTNKKRNTRNYSQQIYKRLSNSESQRNINTPRRIEYINSLTLNTKVAELLGGGWPSRGQIGAWLKRRAV